MDSTVISWLGPVVSSPTGSRRPFLHRIEPCARVALLELGEERTLRDVEIVVPHQERAHTVGVVLDGLVKVTIEDAGGRSTILGIRRPGDLIGFLECCGGTAAPPSTLTALGTATVRVMTCQQFREVLATFPSAGQAATEVLAERVGDSITHRLGAGQPVASRLAACLLALARDHGTSRADGAVVLSFPLTQEELAALVDSSRDAVAKTLMRWRRMNIVETGRRATMILDLARLAERVDA